MERVNRIRNASWVKDVKYVESLKDQYMNEAGKWKLLTREEEVDLAKRMEAGNSAAKKLAEGKVHWKQRAKYEAIVEDGKQAKELMINSNLRLVISEVFRRIRYTEFLDMIQDGNLGLIKAVERFDWRMGNKFSTYATWWVRQAVDRSINSAGIIRAPIHQGDKWDRLCGVKIRLTQGLGRSPTTQEMAAELQRTRWDGDPKVWTVEMVDELIQKFLFPFSLDLPVGKDGDEIWGDRLEDDEQNKEEEILLHHAWLAIRDAIELGLLEERCRLKKNEWQVLRLRFGIDIAGGGITLEEAGKKMNLTRERIRQIEEKALSKLSTSVVLQHLMKELFVKDPSNHKA